MFDEQAFLDAIAENPTDVTQRLIFADWLEEQGDPRCEAVRHQCRFRMPFTRDELKHVERTAAAREHADGTLVEIDLTLPERPPSASLTENTLTAEAKEIIAHLDTNRVARLFPRDRGGRLPLQMTIRLAPLGLDRDYSRMFHWHALVVRGPDNRNVPQQLTVCIVSYRHLIDDDWVEQPWRWDRRVHLSDELTQSGYDQQTAARAAFQAGAQECNRLWSLHEQGPLDESDQVVLATLLLDAGRFEDAFDVCGVGLAPEVTQPLDGLSPWYEKPDRLDRIGRTIRRVLWQCAPWRFHELAAPEIAPEGLLLMPLPGQRLQHKRWFVLGCSSNSQPILEFVETGKTNSISRHLWKRPLEFDIARFHAGLSANEVVPL